MKHPWRYLLLIGLIFVLAACGKGSSEDVTNKKGKTETSDASGGTLNVGIAEAPEGNFQSIFAGSTGDSDVIKFFNDDLVTSDKELKLKPRILSWEVQKDDPLTYTFKMKKDVKWQDGNPLTINDWIFTLETIADPDYTGPRFGDGVQVVKGADEKRKGETDKIEGIRKIDDYTAEITFKENKANNLHNLWLSAPISEKIFKDIPVKDMAKSDAVRKNPIGIGPFKVKSIVDGESVELEKNDDYWQGKPHLDKVNLRVVEQTSMTQALENGEVDMANITAPIAKEIKDNNPENIQLLESPSTSYSIIGFVLNDYDKKSQTIGKERPKYQNKALRQAMALAINRKEWIDAFYYGYGKPLNGLIPSAHWSGAKEGDVKEYEYNVKEAKKLLDNAGYKDKDGDGWREDPKGEKFEVNLKHYAGSNPTFEPRTAAIKGYWEKIGLKTKTEMVEFGKFGADLEKASPDMEVYFRSWQQGSDPDPSGLYKSTALWNESRYNNPEADKVLDEALDGDVVGDDNEKRKEKYLEWQKIMAEDVPVIPIVELTDVYAVNNKLKNLEISLGGTNDIYKWTVAE
ncbi:ABC transporter substrate-binding protein [Staphylococcus felis]|uniref:ABC transporter substrate-binding protein n=1 Tax=Staphylococcus felis TaxID=46127 RepID=A0A2K3ZAN9_9STAP|nr:oligopeptide ABC transporter substrate-binding protein [Staphylococcus felis]AVP36325.1 ABC transporter substrate-binding protein [Staphylococcus felis]PNZ34514.1 ABC transporter substrate-binding protein [Staphylococcus felis]QQB03706.1 ABC transporter substrate-binding protein [Staphylococcus felis]REH92377.1 ABC transporter substrate-binding protein [Staphylococcus felis]REI05732.1 ABC transporter substrate-binding protein [Staphylococcus felis]